MNFGTAKLLPATEVFGSFVHNRLAIRSKRSTLDDVNNTAFFINIFSS